MSYSERSDRTHTLVSLMVVPEKEQQELGFEFPLPRTGASIAVLDYKMYLWGGHTQFLLEAGDDECCPIDETLPNSDDNFIEVYDILSRKWERYATFGSVPDAGDGSTMVGYEDCLYLFGGFNDGVYNGDLYTFNTLSRVWSLVELSDGGEVKPSPRYRMDSVLYDGKMVIFGGVGPLIQSLQPGAQFISTQRYHRDFNYGWNNEMYQFDIAKGCWADVRLKSPEQRPPPCASFTLNMVSTHQAVMFGGNQEEGNVAHIYLFDFKNMTWSMPYKPSSAGQPWPAARSLHTACSVFDPNDVDIISDPHLLVIWGKGRDSKHCNDMWILNTVTMKWNEVCLDLRSRMWHMTTGCYLDGKSEVLIFGGNIRRSSKFERHAITDLVIISFGVLSLKECCLLAVSKHKLQQSPLFSKIPPHIRDRVTKFQYKTMF